MCPYEALRLTWKEFGHMKLEFHSQRRKFVHLVRFGRTAKKKTAQNITKAGVSTDPKIFRLKWPTVEEWSLISINESGNLFLYKCVRIACKTSRKISQRTSSGKQNKLLIMVLKTLRNQPISSKKKPNQEIVSLVLHIQLTLMTLVWSFDRIYKFLWNLGPQIDSIWVFFWERSL